MPIKNEQDMRREAGALLRYFEQRDLSEREAVAIMGLTITVMVADRATLQDFISKLHLAFASDKQTKQ